MALDLLRIVSFNTLFGGHSGFGYGEGVHWEAQMDFLRRLEPDVLALQECNAFELLGKARLYRAVNDLGMARGCLAEANPTTSGHRFHSAILTSHRARVEAEDADRARYHHVLGWAKLRLPGLDRVVDLRNVHLDPLDPRNRAREVAPFEVLAAPGALSLILGDFNTIGLDFPEPDWGKLKPHLLNGHLRLPSAQGEQAGSDRDAVALLGRAGFVDAATSFGQGHVPTAAFGEGDVPRRQDLILASPAVVLADYRVHREPVEAGFSDHCAVSVDIDLAAMSAL